MATADCKRIARITLVHELPTLWSEEDCITARRNRILGAPIGPLPRFSTSKDKRQFGLPLRLMKEEAKLLLDKGLCVSLVELTPAGVLEAVDRFRSLRIDRREAVNQTQAKIALEQRESEILNAADRILEGRRRRKKRRGGGGGEADDLTREQVIADELDKVRSKESKFVELCMEHPYIGEVVLERPVWHYPATAAERLRCAVFRDLWERGFFISCGGKFGGSFLAYHGDPDGCHASFIVKCVDAEGAMDPRDLIASIRVGTATRKVSVLAFLDAAAAADRVRYQSFHWTGGTIDNCLGR